MNIKLVPLTADDREQFILDNQEAFNYGALEEFGRRDDHFEECNQRKGGKACKIKDATHRSMHATLHFLRTQIAWCMFGSQARCRVKMCP